MPTLARATIAATMALAALTLAVIVRAPRDLDRAVTAALHDAGSPALDLAATLHTFVALWPISVAMAAVAALVIWQRHRDRRLALAPLAVVLGVAIEAVLKLTLDHPGPTPDLDRALFRPAVPAVPTPSSFPSGHALRITFFLLLAAIWLRPGRVGWALVVAAIAASAMLRVYLGDHWASDVAGGVALGTAVACATALWARLSRERPRSRPWPDGSRRSR